MPNAISCAGGRWCERANALLGVEGLHFCFVTAAGTGLVLHVETAETVSGCPDCSVVAVGHGAGRCGSMTPRVSAVRCGCSGPGVFGAARTLIVREPRSPKSTSWLGPAQNLRPGPWRGRPTGCSVSTPRVSGLAH